MAATLGGTLGTGRLGSKSRRSKEKANSNLVAGGLEHRPFEDDEIKIAFDCFDLDKNHFVGVQEIHHILQSIGEEVTDEEIDEMIRLCDADGDGQVTFDEFYKLMTNPPPIPPVNTVQAAPKRRKPTAGSKLTGYGGASSAAASSSGAGTQASERQFRAASVETLVKRLSGGIGKIKPSQIKKVYKRFREIDKDGSNSIDYQEFLLALDIEDDSVSSKMFRIFDMDGSGAIDLKEFIVVLSRYTSAARSEKLKFAFMMFDEDGSGFIEREELVEMLAASFIIEGLAHEELQAKADQVFAYLRLDPEGSISYDDFLKLAKAKQGLIYPVEDDDVKLPQ